MSERVGANNSKPQRISKDLLEDVNRYLEKNDLKIPWVYGTTLYVKEKKRLEEENARYRKQLEELLRKRGGGSLL